MDLCLCFCFELVLVAAKRAHQLNSGGYRSTLDVGKDKATVVALREIEGVALCIIYYLIDCSLQLESRKTTFV